MKLFPTTREVWQAIRQDHLAELVPFSTFSNPEPSHLSYERVMMTEFGFANATTPLIRIETRWDRLDEKSNRINETTQYWFCGGWEVE